MDYMAPEQLQDREPDERTNVYNLGATLYAMLAGGPPAGNGTEGAERKEQPPPLADRRRGQPPLPTALEAVVMRSLDKDPDGRFQSAAELREALLASMSQPQEEEAGPAAVSSDQLRPGDQIGDYRITDVLCRGGFATVFRAEHVKFDREVALKVLHLGAVQQPEDIHRFFREVRAINEIGHPNIVEVYHFIQQPDRDPPLYCAVMELLQGQDVHSRIHAKKLLDASEVVSIGAQVADALDAAHQAKILHRDVKPANIFMARQPDGSTCVKLLDFGLSKGFGDLDQDQLTAAGMAVGTPEYMAPEQIRGQELDERVDIYGLGASLYEMLAGLPPFGTVSDTVGFGDIMVSQVNDPPPPLPERWKGPPVPPDLQAVIMRCLEKDPDDRFRNARELRAALLVCQRDAAGQATPASTDPASPHARPGSQLDAPAEMMLAGQGADDPPGPAGAEASAAAARTERRGPPSRAASERGEVSASDLRVLTKMESPRRPGSSSGRWLVVGLAAVAVAAISATIWLLLSRGDYTSSSREESAEQQGRPALDAGSPVVRRTAVGGGDGGRVAPAAASPARAARPRKPSKRADREANRERRRSRHVRGSGRGRRPEESAKPRTADKVPLQGTIDPFNE